MTQTMRDLLAQIERLGQLLDGERSLSAARLRTIRHQREVIDELRARMHGSPALDEAALVAERAWGKVTDQEAA